MVKNIGVLGTGAVGGTLANGLKELGYEVSVGSRNGKKIDGWAGNVGTFDEVAKKAELIILAVKGSVAKELVQNLTAELAGKTVIDTTNPIASEPPENGVLKYFTDLNSSLMEQLQEIAPHTQFVKAFNSVGANVMVKPTFELTPSMFICGNNETAKSEVSELLTKLGWEAEDMGKAEAARAIEPLCILWCIPAILHGQRQQVFKLLKQ